MQPDQKLRRADTPIEPGNRVLERISRVPKQASQAFAVDLGPEDPALHAHPHGQVAYSPSDPLMVMTEASCLIALPATAVWIPPGVPHQVLSRRRRRMLNLYLSPSQCAALPQASRSFPASPLLIELLRVLSRPSEPARGSYSRALAHAASEEIGRLLELTANARDIALPQPAEPHLQEIARALATNPGGGRGLSDWAEHFGKSPKTLSREIKRSLGTTFREWQLSHKMVEARERLRAGESVKSVAFRLGYSNPNILVATFRRLFGTTPGRLRNETGN